MTFPFPGMNPYLEHPDLWPEVHNRLIVAMANGIETNLNRDYRVAIEKRTYTSVPEDSVLVGIPDVAVLTPTGGAEQPLPQSLPALENSGGAAVTVTLPMPQATREAYLEIRDVSTGFVVTVIEVLSPSNKRPGKGREAYLNKRMEVLASPTHLVEFDLLRAGLPLPLLSETQATDYRIVVSRGERRPQAQLYAFSLRQSIPTVPLPLRRDEVEPMIDVQSLLRQIYPQARFELAIDYTLPPVPPLSADDQAWWEGSYPH